MTIKAFFVDALGGALELGIATPDDVLRHATPEVLAEFLPKPLWARLLTACLGAPRVDAQLVVETIGVPNLCEHVPATIIWACIAELGARSLGRPPESAEPVAGTPARDRTPSLAPPPPETVAPARPAPARTIAVGPSIPAPINEPLADLISELEADDRAIATPRARTPTAQRFRQSGTGLGRAASQARRPQAHAAAAAQPESTGRPVRRGATEVNELEADTELGGEWRNKEPLAVDDSQLVDWKSSEAAIPNDDDFGDLGRKR